MPPKKGNLNALKHGLYAKRYSKDERKSLAQMDPASLAQEIALMRVTADRILSLIDQTQDADSLVKLYNTLATSITTLNTLARTHALLTGNYSPLEDALTEALLHTDPHDE